MHPSFNQNIFLHIQLNCFLGHVQKGKVHYRHCICLTFAKEKILMLAWSTDRLLVQFFLCDLLTYQCGLYYFRFYWMWNVHLIQGGGVRGCISNYFSIGHISKVIEEGYKMVSCLQEWLEIYKNIGITIQKCIFPLFVGHA